MGVGEAGAAGRRAPALSDPARKSMPAWGVGAGEGPPEPASATATPGSPTAVMGDTSGLSGRLRALSLRSSAMSSAREWLREALPSPTPYAATGSSGGGSMPPLCVEASGSRHRGSVDEAPPTPTPQLPCPSRFPE